MKKIYVMIGNYGSGKSELALNFAFKAAETGKTELIDLDLVNTYFRLTERGKLVEQKEIRLISPNYACSGVETLSLPAEVASAFAMNWDTVVFDVGGDAVGSTALGRYYEDFQDFMAMGPEQLEVLNVVNIRRPLAGGRFGAYAPQHPFQHADTFSNQNYRMGKTVGVAHQKVYAKADNKCRKRPHHAVSPPPCIVKI